ncbi:NAD(P)-dependent oxidoreductase [candidate division KSB1 bacterium]|nr:NAD(P)-dependent oxidoreductase [candidate division KSB1 bacterium]
MRILITGGAGYLGAMTSQLLSESGHTVICLDTKKKPDSWNEKNSLFKGIRYVQGSVCDSALVEKVTANIDAIVHMSFIVGGPATHQNPEQARTLALDGTDIVSTVAKDRILLFTSTDAIYSDDFQGELCDETASCAPNSMYGELKVAAENRVREVKQPIILRLPTHFGVSVSMRQDLLVHTLVRDMYKFGKLEIYEAQNLRTLIHIKDSAEAIRFSLENSSKITGDVYNVASGVWTKGEIAHTIAEISGGAITLSNDQMDSSIIAKRNFALNCNKFQAFGWKPQRCDLKQGITELWEYFQKSNFKN